MDIAVYFTATRKVSGCKIEKKDVGKQLTCSKFDYWQHSNI
jgi:hypothetical protein